MDFGSYNSQFRAVVGSGQRRVVGGGASEFVIIERKDRSPLVVSVLEKKYIHFTVYTDTCPYTFAHGQAYFLDPSTVQYTTIHLFHIIL